MDYVVWKEGKYYVSQCINVNVSSLGENIGLIGAGWIMNKRRAFAEIKDNPKNVRFNKRDLLFNIRILNIK